MSSIGSNPREQDMANFPSNSLDRHTQRQAWVYKQMGFLKSHMRRKGANRSLGFESSTTRQHDDSRGSTTDGYSLESSVRTSKTNLPLPASTLLFEQIQTLISFFNQQKSTSDRQPFYNYIASEGDKMSPEEYEKFKSSTLSRM